MDGKKGKANSSLLCCYSIELRINLGARARAESELRQKFMPSGGQATSAAAAAAGAAAADFTSKLMGVQMHHSDGHHQSLPIKQSTKQTAATAAAAAEAAPTATATTAATCCP